VSVKINQKEGVTLDIVIPHLVFPQLEKTLRLLRANTPPCFRVILIDQSRNDNSYLQKEGLVDVIVKTKKNLGFAKACNTGLRISDAEYVMLLNDDVFLLSKTWLQDCMTVFRDRADAAAVNLSSPRNPHGGGGIVDQFPSEAAIERGYWTDEEIHQIKLIFDGVNTKPGCEQIYPAGCLYAPIFKRSALEALGKHAGSPYGIALLDESFGTGGGEDYHFVRSLGLIGLRFYGTYRAWGYHFWLSTRSMMKEAGYGEDAYQTTKKGYDRFRELWGSTHGKGPNDTPDGADVYGRSGPKEPLDGQPWFTVTPL